MTWLTRPCRAYLNWRNYRDTCRELRRLADSDLADLGLGRGDIRAVARRAAGF